MKKTIILVLSMMAFGQLAMAAPKTFKMYKEPHARVTPFCDVFTKLVLDVDGETGRAQLSNHLSGACEIYVPLNKRSYNLVLTETDCGTKIYSSKNYEEETDDAAAGIVVIDNRSRRCENLIPAWIVVQEFDGDGSLSELYSKD